MKQIIRLTESDLHKLIKESVNTILYEGKETRLTNRLMNQLYKVFNKQFGGIYSDSGWQNVDIALGALQEVDGVADVVCSAGRYENYLNGDGSRPPVRRYQLEIQTQFGTQINGELMCHSAGTIEDPFSRYDMSISLWRA